jgi:hypothetical protein
MDGHIGGTIADHGTGPGDQGTDADPLYVVGVDNGRAALRGELPELLRAAADTDLDGPLGVEHPIQTCQAKGAAVLEGQ